MSAPFDSLPTCSFIQVPFLAEHISIKGALRSHIHEYPHTAGGRPEKLGRRLYTIMIDGVFLVGNLDFPQAWPGDIGLLRAQFEQQVTGDLVIPTVGTIKAFCTDWDIENTTKMRNGERMRMTFQEDQEIDQLVDSPLVFNYTNVAAKADALANAAFAAGLKMDLFQSLQDLANQVQGLVDQAELQVELVALKAEQLANTCRTFDNIIKELNNPPMYKVVAALQDLGVAADNLAGDALKQLNPINVFVVPTVMSIGQIATSIYGSTAKAVEMLKLNPIDDAFAIQPGTAIAHYAP